MTFLKSKFAILIIVAIILGGVTGFYLYTMKNPQKPIPVITTTGGVLQTISGEILSIKTISGEILSIKTISGGVAPIGTDSGTETTQPLKAEDIMKELEKTE